MHKLTAAEMMRLCRVNRWNMVATNREQSVAEHTFGVITYAIEICRMERCEELIPEVMQAAYVHDASEVMTGDIPTPVKAHLMDKDKMRQFEESVYFGVPAFCSYSSKVKLIVKRADLLEAAIYLYRHGDSAHASNISIDMRNAVMADETLKNIWSWSGTQRTLDNLYETPQEELYKGKLA